MQAFGMENATASRFAAAAEQAFEAARVSTTDASLPYRHRHLHGLGQRRRSALVRRSGRDERHHDAGPALAIRPLRGVRRELPRPTLGSLRRTGSSRRRSRTAGRNPRRRADDPRASPAGCHAGSLARRSDVSRRLVFLSGKQRPAIASKASRSGSLRASGWPWSVRPGPARAPSCNCCFGSTIRRKATSWWMECRSPKPIRWRCAPAWPSYRRSRRSLEPACATTSAMAATMPRMRTSSAPPPWRPPTVSSGRCRKATTPSSGSAA